MSALGKRATQPKKRGERERIRKKMKINTRATRYTTTQTPPHVKNTHNASKTHHHPAEINQQAIQAGYHSKKHKRRGENIRSKLTPHMK